MRPLAAALAAFLLGACAAAAPPDVVSPDAGRAAPEAATGWTARAPVTAEQFMVVAAHPLAAEAGRSVLARGGSAVDAAIAVQAVLTLVEPQSSGIGGGAFLLHWDTEDGRATAWDGRETAPAAATPDRFLGADGKPLPFMEAVVGGRSVGVPGVLRMLEAAHAAHGRLPWAGLFAHAIVLAEDGFPVSPRLHALLAGDTHLPAQAAARAAFYGSDGSPPPVGAVLRNPALAKVLRAVAEDGADALHRGPLAEAIVATVRAHGGDMTLEDLAGYRPVRRDPVCAPYRAWSVCGMGPPSSGGVAIGQMLGLLERFDLAALPADSPQVAHLLAEAGRLAFADRNAFLADPDVAEVPVEGLLDPGYLAARSLLIDPARAMEDAVPGTPPGTVRAAEGASWERPSTTQVSIVDAWGDAVSMTSSIENAFGSRLMVEGFLLNNQLTDFSFNPQADGRPVANRVEPGKRPRSSMSPTLVLGGDGHLAAVTGSPGGARIIGTVARSLVAMLDHGLDPQAAASLPHALNRDRAETEVETPALAEALKGYGHAVTVTDITSGLATIVVRRDGTLVGGADPRREGVALGEAAAPTPDPSAAAAFPDGRRRAPDPPSR
ncbi:gamma-glutamyltransferase [Novispirillum sp. DQ9]|uniref:gamma-glutamyltransferase n=1 Tax=Novispirillum sp. DQ9 TaxID=3398612 RepID=UPI003C7B8B78